MASEAKLIIELEPPIPFTVSNTTGIAKGSVLKMADPMTASQSTDEADIPAGIAASEKIASDGKTKLGVYRKGIFKVTASGSITVGDAMITSEVDNELATAAVDAENLIGIALETATDGETLLMELNPRVVNLA